ncbi:Uncharacterized protein FKW44_023707, partial [Caligus rogercresseyi]
CLIAAPPDVNDCLSLKSDANKGMPFTLQISSWNRDSEIAVGAFQPAYVEQDFPEGGVHKYRMALWAAHLGGYNEQFIHPETSDCLNTVTEITTDFWETYFRGSVSLRHGDVEPLDEPWDCFPDTNAKVMGAKSGYLPAKLTT